MSSHYSSTRGRKMKRNCAPEVPMCREIMPEYNFHLETFRNPLTQWTINCLETLGFISLASPTAKIYYPRIVNEFYFNLIPLNNGLAFQTTIDNFRFVFNESDIAMALGVSVSCPLGSNIQPCIKESFDVLDKDLRIRGKNNRNFIHQAQLPSDLWLLDMILFHNIACTSHEFHRSGSFLQALFAAKNKKWFSPASLIRASIIETAELINQKSRKMDKINLFYPYLITRLLLQSGYLPHVEEHQGIKTNTFGASEWNRAHFAIIDKIDQIRQETKRIAGTPTTPSTSNEAYDIPDRDKDESSSGSSVPKYQPFAHEAISVHLKLATKIDDLIDLIESIKDTLSPEQCSKTLMEFERRRNARNQN